MSDRESSPERHVKDVSREASAESYSPGRRKRSSRSRSYSPRRRRSASRSPGSARRRHTGDRVNGRGRSQEKPTPSRCLGVFGLSLYTQTRHLREVFSKYGGIDEITIVTDAQTGRSRGFAFVYFEAVEDAENAKESCNGIEIDNRKIRVDFSITKRPHTPTPGIYMGRPTQYSRRPRGRRGGGYGGGYDRGYDRGYDDRYDDRRGGDFRRGGDYRDDYRRSPSPYYRRSYRRSRSRSYSPNYSNGAGGGRYRY